MPLLVSSIGRVRSARHHQNGWPVTNGRIAKPALAVTVPDQEIPSGSVLR
jgi:hypothetical protein